MKRERVLNEDHLDRRYLSATTKHDEKTTGRRSTAQTQVTDKDTLHHMPPLASPEDAEIHDMPAGSSARCRTLQA